MNPFEMLKNMLLVGKMKIITPIFIIILSVLLIDFLYKMKDYKSERESTHSENKDL